MYLADTRPNNSYALSTVNQLMHNPGEKHMQAIMKIIYYLNAAPRKGILFIKNDHCLKVKGYTDADYTKNIGDI